MSDSRKHHRIAAVAVPGRALFKKLRARAVANGIFYAVAEKTHETCSLVHYLTAYKDQLSEQGTHVADSFANNINQSDFFLESNINFYRVTISGTKSKSAELHLMILASSYSDDDMCDYFNRDTVSQINIFLNAATNTGKQIYFMCEDATMLSNTLYASLKMRDALVNCQPGNPWPLQILRQAYVDADVQVQHNIATLNEQAALAYQLQLVRTGKSQTSMRKLVTSLNAHSACRRIPVNAQLQTHVNHLIRIIEDPHYWQQYVHGSTDVVPKGVTVLRAVINAYRHDTIQLLNMIAAIGRRKVADPIQTQPRQLIATLFREVSYRDQHLKDFYRYCASIDIDGQSFGNAALWKSISNQYQHWFHPPINAMQM